MKLSYLDLCTGHLAKDTMRELESPGKLSGCTVAPYEFGVFVSVPSELSDIDGLECSGDLKQVLRYARGEGCDVVRFDRDAGIIADLPYFDW